VGKAGYDITVEELGFDLSTLIQEIERTGVPAGGSTEISQMFARYLDNGGGKNGELENAIKYLTWVLPRYIRDRLEIIADSDGDVEGTAEVLQDKIAEMVDLF